MYGKNYFLTEKENAPPCFRLTLRLCLQFYVMIKTYISTPYGSFIMYSYLSLIKLLFCH